ncbi:hypothetical protein [Paraburkholderia tropica]|uniref:hypothetical protein n=1 Tax=Paraburkholderia tropica TaxID=92647 RepID=UPI002AB2A36E|nr:hypothetical protein [Paraburkholderia tropica]
MNTRKKRIAKTGAEPGDTKPVYKTNPGAYWQSRIDHERKVHLAGEAILRRVERGEWDQADFLKMMNDYLERPADRALFGLD